MTWEELAWWCYFPPPWAHGRLTVARVRLGHGVWRRLPAVLLSCTHGPRWTLYAGSCLVRQTVSLFPSPKGISIQSFQGCLKLQTQRSVPQNMGQNFDPFSCLSNPRPGAKASSLNEEQLVGCKWEGVWLSEHLIIILLRCLWFPFRIVIPSCQMQYKCIDTVPIVLYLICTYVCMCVKPIYTET